MMNICKKCGSEVADSTTVFIDGEPYGATCAREIRRERMKQQFRIDLKASIAKKRAAGDLNGADLDERLLRKINSGR
jgi:hypothetical protein